MSLRLCICTWAAVLSAVFAMNGAQANTRSNFLSKSFQAGVTHSNGTYSFTNQNFLIEGAQKIQSLGAPSIFVYMTPNYKTAYPDKGNGLWGAGASNLTQLAQTPAYRQLFNMPFKYFVITAMSFANVDHITTFGPSSPSVSQATASERDEFYNLAKYLINTYKGTGKVFILKNWEGDYAALQGFDRSKDITHELASAMVNWMVSRQQGVEQARRDMGDPDGVSVLNAVELSLVVDAVEQNKVRLLNAVLPYAHTDMVTYSSYDSTLNWCSNKTTEQCINEALTAIDHSAADPLGLGRKRILISEYGLFENERAVADVTWRAATILGLARDFGIAGAFFWEVYDNECTVNGQHFPIAGIGSRPQNNQCRGLWLIRPDGSKSLSLPVLQKFWGVSSSTGTYGADVSVSSPTQGQVTDGYYHWITVKASAVPTGGASVDHMELWANGVKLKAGDGVADFFSSNISPSIWFASNTYYLTAVAVDKSGKVLGKSTQIKFIVP